MGEGKKVQKLVERIKEVISTEEFVEDARQEWRDEAGHRLKRMLTFADKLQMAIGEVSGMEAAYALRSYAIEQMDEMVSHMTMPGEEGEDGEGEETGVTSPDTSGTSH